jgi:hypothetical protein
MSEDSSPILLRLKPEEQEYKFFLFVISIYNLKTFGETFDPANHPEEFLKTFNFKEYNKLLIKFSLEDSNDSICEISVFQTVLLLTMVDSVAKELLSNNVDAFKLLVSTNFENIQADWDSIFFKSAQNIFEMYKEQFQKFPKLAELIDDIINTFN